MLKRLWGRIKCAFGKHGRGKRIVANVEIPADANYNVFECPRCHFQWMRKLRQPKEKK